MHTEMYDSAIVNCRIILAVFLLAALLFVGGASALYSGGPSDVTTDNGVVQLTYADDYCIEANSAIKGDAEREQALAAVMAKYQNEVSALEYNSRIIYFIEGYGANTTAGSRSSAMCVVVIDGIIKFVSTYSATLPDMAVESNTVLDGVCRANPCWHNYTAKIYDDENNLYTPCPALKMQDISVMENSMVTSEVNNYSASSLTPYNIHWTGYSYDRVNQKDVASAGCLLVGKIISGMLTANKCSEYDRFAYIVGFAANTYYNNSKGLWFGDTMKNAPHTLGNYDYHSGTPVSVNDLENINSSIVVIDRAYGYEQNGTAKKYLLDKYNNNMTYIIKVLGYDPNITKKYEDSSITAPSGSCGDDLTWTLNTDTGVLEIDGTGDMTDSYSGWRDYCSSIKTISLGSGVTSIGTGAFVNCTALTSVSIPDSVTSIGYGAFLSCTALTSIPIPDSVTSIGESAFFSCHALTSVTIPDSVITIGNKAFLDCSALSTVTIGNSVTSIGNYAFSSCPNLEQVDLKNAVDLSNVGPGAFGDNSYSAMKSGSSIYVSDEDAAALFIAGVNYYAPSTTIVVPESSTTMYNGTCGNNLIWTLNTDTGVLEIEGTGKMTNYYYGRPGWYQYRNNITTVSLSSGVTSIGESAFSGCTSLTSAIIGNGVTSIGDHAFDGCSSLTSVTIGNGVTSIGWWAFWDCTALTSVIIPDSVTSIGRYAFWDCTALTSVTIGNGVTSIGDSAFDGCRSLTSVTIGNSVTIIGYNAFYSCSSLISVVIPDSVTSIQGSAFSDCSNLTHVIIGNGETSIGDRSFSGCVNLASVSLPEGVTSIGMFAFSDCTALASVVIPDSVTSIRQYAFSHCTALTSVDIGNGVISIGESSFSGCSNLTSVIIGNNVTTIEFDAFRSCRSLTSVIIPDSVTSINSDAFSGCSSLTSIIIGDGVTSIGWGAFSDCSNLQIVDLSDTTALSSVGRYAFGSWSNNAMKSGSVIYVSNKDAAALFIAGTNYYAPNTRIIVGKPVQNITYIIQYDANSGTGNMTDQTFTYNKTQNLSANTFVKNASVFSGWATTIGGHIVYTDGQSVRNLLTTDGATLILYAVWSKNTNLNISDFSLPLSAGWNFISVPKTLNSTENTAGYLFGNVETNNKNILGYNTQTGTWVPILDKNEIIQPLNGYWIYSANSTIISLTLMLGPTPHYAKTLYHGWNAIGLSADAQPSPDIALACLGSSWKTVIPWNLSTGMYESAIVNEGSGANSPDHLMTLGNGYWLYVDSQSTLTALTA